MSLYDILRSAIIDNEYSLFINQYTHRLSDSEKIILFHAACIWNRVNIMDHMVQKGFKLSSDMTVPVSISHTEETIRPMPIIFECISYAALESLEWLLVHGVSAEAFHPDTGKSAYEYALRRTDPGFAESLIRHAGLG